MHLNDILRKAFEQDASDIHLVADHPPMMRVHTVMQPMECPALTGDGLRRALEQMVSPAQLALAWLSSRGEHVVPIPGTTNIDHLREIIAAAQLEVTPDILERAGELIGTETVSGPRYPANNAVEVDTETFEDAA